MNEEHGYGAVLSAPDVRDYVAMAVKGDFPAEFELNMPKVKDQGSIGSCVAHALSTVVEYFAHRETGQSEAMSTGYIYGNRRLTNYSKKGMVVRDAIKTAVKYGDVPDIKFPLNVEVPYAINKFEEKADELFEVGRPFRFKTYFKLTNNNDIKASIMANGPALMSMRWFDGLKIKNGVMYFDETKTSYKSSHCMVIYGWNEIGWKVQNSWGSLWGDNGRVIIPYDVPIREVWGITDEDACGDLTIKKPFSSKVGAIVAKVLNFVASIFYNLKG